MHGVINLQDKIFTVRDRMERVKKQAIARIEENQKEIESIIEEYRKMKTFC